MNVSRRCFITGTGAALAAPVALRAGENVPLPCSVDFGARTGKKIKALNGTNLGPRISDEGTPRRMADFKRLNVSLVRLHDAPHENTGANLVDVQFLFPLWYPKADPKDPSAYFFKATDDCIRAILDNSRAEIVYRLGTSIECGPYHYFAKEPKDHARYAEICAGIVRHYTQGWADGFKWPVNFWEIWNEPDGVPPNWDQENFATYVSLYVDVAKRLRSEFPAIKIGGPALSWIGHKEAAKLLVETCRARNAPLDFFSWHSYPYLPQQITPGATWSRNLLDDNGFRQTEVWLDEWHYLPSKGFAPLFEKGGRRRWVDTPDGMNGIDGAAFVTACLTAWQDIPLDRSCFYATGLTNYGFYDYYGDIRPTYHAMRLFGDFMAAKPDRVKSQGTDGVYVLGGIGEDGGKKLLVTCFKPSGPSSVRVKLAGVPEKGSAALLRLDSRGEAELSQPYADSELTLPADSSAIFLVKV